MFCVLLRLGVVGHAHDPDWPQKVSELNSTVQLNGPKAFPDKLASTGTAVHSHLK